MAWLGSAATNETARVFDVSSFSFSFLSVEPWSEAANVLMIKLLRRAQRGQIRAKTSYIPCATSIQTTRSLASSNRLSSRSHSILSTDNLKQPLQAYVSTSLDPFENLAIEHYLLSNTPTSSRILLFYINRPCVVIGRNQNPWVECNLNALREGLRQEQGHESSSPGHSSHEEIRFVRRRSGGGTVYHDDGNLNYSIIVPNDKSFTRRRYPELVVEALKHTPWGNADISVNERNDIVLRDAALASRPLKISGSAYKLTRGRALAHGTLLFASPNLSRISSLLHSPGTPYLHAKGVESVRSPVRNLIKAETSYEARKGYADSLINAIAHTWHSEETAGLSDAEPLSLVNVGSDDCQPEINPKLASGVEELRSDAWRFEQTPKFDVEVGSVEDVPLKMQIKHGQIDTVEITMSHNSAVAHADFEHGLEQALVGRKLHEIKAWHQLLNGPQLPQQVVEQLSSIFPFVSTGLSDRREAVVKDEPNLVEEPGTNTVREIL